jgi:integrase
VEDLIHNTQTLRDRLILELQARCGLRIGEALKIRVSDVVDRKLVLQESKSGKGQCGWGLRLGVGAKRNKKGIKLDMG